MSFSLIQITAKGRALLARAQTGATINFTHIKMGDGEMGGQSIDDMTNVINLKKELDITGLKVLSGGKVKVQATFTNQGLSTGFYWREIAVFATDPDNVSAEIMYCYGNAGALADYIPAEGSQILERVISVLTIISNATNVTATINESLVYVTKQDVDVVGGVTSFDTFKSHLLEFDTLSSTISSGAIQSPSIGLGITRIQIPEMSVSPKFVFNGIAYPNLIGRDGNCEDTSKWQHGTAIPTLDTANKVFGNNAIKITISSGNGTIYKSAPTLDVTKYYFLSAYVSKGNATSVTITKDNTGGGVSKSVVSSVASMTRIGVKIQPSDINPLNLIVIAVSGTDGQYGYVDGVMLNEISASDDTLTDVQLMDKYGYVDSYGALTNPCFENRRYNLVRNGNCEEGISYWVNSDPVNLTLTNENGRFKAVSNSAGVVISQRMQVKANTNYYIIRNLTGTITLRVVDYPVTNALISTSGTFNSGSNTLIEVQLLGITGTAYFDSIMLVEGTVAPTAYLSCDLQKYVLEGQFTQKDTLVVENDKVSGLLYSKHNVLFGKNYDWQFNNDYSGFKRLIIPANVKLKGINGYPTVVKYNGDIVKPVTTWNVADLYQFSSDGSFYLTVSDSETGWGETVNPNNAEVQLFKNGWRAVSSNGTRYTSWVSIVDGTAPTGSINTKTTGSNALNQAVVNVVSSAGLSVGDNVAIGQSNGTYAWYAIATINSPTQITLTGNLISTVNANSIVIKADIPAVSTPLLAWCKNNVAPNYEGTRIHYDLAVPEPITDVNVHVNGEIWDLVKGDNYINIDSGIVLEEVANPVFDTLTYWQVNLNQPYAVGSLLTNKAEDIFHLYKNNMDYSYNCSFVSDTEAYGKERLGIVASTYDPNATYTVDYQILKTLHAQSFGSLAMSYTQSIVATLEDHSKGLEQKQNHSTLLDNMVNLSTYEVIKTPSVVRPWFTNGTSLYISFVIPFSVKKDTVPSIAISNLFINKGVGFTVITDKFMFDAMVVTKNEVVYTVVCLDASTNTDIKTYGAYGSVTITANCKRRV
jgi:hypothetical protein